MLTRTIYIVLTYDIVLDGPELMAGSKLWLDDLKSVMNDLAARDGPGDLILLRKLEAVVRLLMKADDLRGKRSKTYHNSRMLLRLRQCSDASRWKASLTAICAFLFSFVHQSIESGQTIYAKPLKKLDTISPTNEQIGDLIENLQYNSFDHSGYEPDYLERLLRVRPKLDMLYA